MNERSRSAVNFKWAMGSRSYKMKRKSVEKLAMQFGMSCVDLPFRRFMLTDQEYWQQSKWIVGVTRLRHTCICMNPITWFHSHKNLSKQLRWQTKYEFYSFAKWMNKVCAYIYFLWIVQFFSAQTHSILSWHLQRKKESTYEARVDIINLI